MYNLLIWYTRLQHKHNNTICLSVWFRTTYPLSNYQNIMRLTEMWCTTVFLPPLPKRPLIANGHQSFLCWQVFHPLPSWWCHNVVHSATPGVKVHQLWRSNLTLSAPPVHLIGHSLSERTQVWESCLGTCSYTFTWSNQPDKIDPVQLLWFTKQAAWCCSSEI